MTVSECPQCSPPEKLSILCEHLRVSGDQEDGGVQSTVSGISEDESPVMAQFRRFQNRRGRGKSSKTAACNRELLSLALTGSSFSDSFSTLFKYSPLRNWGRDESSLNKLKQNIWGYLTKLELYTQLHWTFLSAASFPGGPLNVETACYIVQPFV